MNNAAPEATEVPACPLCGLSTQGIQVGTRGRFGIAVRNIACEKCALVYQTPRPTLEAMAEYYSGAYREHYGEVRYPTANGGAAGPGEPDYEQALETWHTNQANHALMLGRTPHGARVLEIGCRHARTLCIMRERAGIQAYGIEPGPEEANQAARAGVDCFNGTLENYEPGELKFDQVQLFHVLEHFHDPLAALLRIRTWLAPKARLVIEVPNVYQPYGLLEENFFQNAHLTNFSSVTLGALLARAGFVVETTLDEGALFMTASLGPAQALPIPFSEALLSEPTHDAKWIAERLGNYALLERLRLILRQRGPSLELVQRTAHTLQQPTFVAHTVSTVCEMVEYFLKAQAPRLALLVASAAQVGPHPPEVRAKFEELAQAIARQMQAA